MLGAVINCVPPTIIERVKGVVVPVLNKNGVNVPGVIPESISLRAPSVKEITEKLACTILAGEDRVDKLVENFLVGAMTPERALTYFRGSKNKGVITGLGVKIDFRKLKNTYYIISLKLQNMNSQKYSRSSRSPEATTTS